MSLRVTIEGQGSFEVAKECVEKVVYKTDIPLDSNAPPKTWAAPWTFPARS